MTRYGAVLWRRLPWVLVPAIVLALTAWLYSASRPAEYEATARVLRDTTTTRDAVTSRLALDIDVDLSNRDIVNEINVAESDAVRQEVSRRLDVAVDELPEGSVTDDGEDDYSDILDFTSRGSSAEEASLTANTWAEAYVDLKRESSQQGIDSLVDQLEQDLTALRVDRIELRQQLQPFEDQLDRTTDPTQRALLQSRIDQEASAIGGDLGLIDAQISANVESISRLRLSGEFVESPQILRAATEPTSPANASSIAYLIVGGLLGLMVGSRLAAVVDRRDRSIRDTEDAEQLGFAVLGEIPQAPKSLAGHGLATIAQTMPGGIYADGFQNIRTALEQVTSTGDTKTVLITSPNSGDGKTTLAVNLALACANVGSRVLLVDSDFRRPALHKIFSAPQAPGFANALEDKTPLHEASIDAQGFTETLRLLPVGTAPDDPAAFLAAHIEPSIMSQLRPHAELVLIDSPPTLPVADALSITPHADGVLLVVSARRTTRDELVKAAGEIRRAGGSVLGVVINRTDISNQKAFGAINQPSLKSVRAGQTANDDADHVQVGPRRSHLLPQGSLNTTT